MVQALAVPAHIGGLVIVTTGCTAATPPVSKAPLSGADPLKQLGALVGHAGIVIEAATMVGVPESIAGDPGLLSLK
jgi:hypothetical protein